MLNFILTSFTTSYVLDNPKIATSGGLIIGVKNLPPTPLKDETENVAPESCSLFSLLFFAVFAKYLISSEILIIDFYLHL